MNPADAFIQRLDAAEQHPSRPAEVASEAGGVRVHATVLDRDRLAAVCETLTITRSARADTDALARRARALAGRVSYLEEPLAVVEIDDPARTALLRSAPPLAEGDQRVFYEVTLREDRATLQRFRTGGRSSRRRAVPFTLTRGLLTRLINDVADCLTL